MGPPRCFGMLVLSALKGGVHCGIDSLTDVTVLGISWWISIHIVAHVSSCGELTDLESSRQDGSHQSYPGIRRGSGSGSSSTRHCRSQH